MNALEGAKRRKTTTRRIGCPFKLYGKRVPNSDKWGLKVRDSVHNHTTNDNMIGHPAARTLTEEQRQQIQNLSEVGSKHRDILALIQKEHTLVAPRDISNARSTVRRQKLGNNTPLEYLLKTLQENAWKYATKQDSEGRILFFVFAHPDAIRYAKQYNIAFVLGCTYKMNRHKMPLFHFIGVSLSNSAFSIAFCFMQNEQEESSISTGL